MAYQWKVDKIIKENMADSQPIGRTGDVTGAQNFQNSWFQCCKMIKY